MSRSPDDVQRDIERARQDLAETLDELTERASPKRLVARGKATLRDSVQTPVGKAVLGAAVGLIVVIVALRIKGHRA